MKMRILTAALLVVLSLLAVFTHRKSSIYEAEYHNFRHRADVYHYFTDLFCRQDFGYTLLGAKPVSINWCLGATPFNKQLQKIVFDSKTFF